MDEGSRNRFVKNSDHSWNRPEPTTVTQPQLPSHNFSETSPSPVITSTSMPGSASKSSNISPHLGGPQEETSTMQRTAVSSEPSNERLKLTKTGRISKAKKGVRVHDCETCGKSYTRAEHLRRHQLNHSTGSLKCDFAGCGKTFHREDLLSRHRERHLDNQIGQNPRDSTQSPSSPEASGRNSYTSLPAPDTSEPPCSVAPPATTTYTSTIASPPSHISSPSITKRPSLTNQYQNRSVPPAVISERNWNYPSDFNNSNDVWMASPPYSSSSGYGSPNYANLTLSFAGQPHAQLLDRQRSFSNTSLIDQYLPQPVTTTKSQISPTSSILEPYWTVWNTEQQGREYSLTSAPPAYEFRTTSLPRTPSLVSYPLPFPQFDSTAMAFISRDVLEAEEFGFQEEEDAIYMQYLIQFWEHFHPQYPVLHRSSFSLAAVPPLLKAVVLAIGSQYSHSLDWNAKQYSRKLYDQCLKTLAKRLQEGCESRRVYDMQAVFLVEIYTQYMNRRTPPSLSSRFKTLYDTLCLDPSIVSPMPLECIFSIQLQADELSLPQEWMHHGELLTLMLKRRLLSSCYVLDSQKRSLFPQSSEDDRLSGHSLPFVCSTEQWDTTTPEEMLQRQDTAEFAYISEILNRTPTVRTPDAEPYDTFRSALLIAAAKETDPTTLDTARLEPTSSTQLLYLANVLSHHTPLRALLAVAGETWVMGEKVATNDEYQKLRAILRIWTAEKGVRENSAAICTALRILRLECNSEARNAKLIEQWAIYLAALVLWATAYTVQRPRLKAPFLPTQKGSASGDAQMPVQATFSAIEQGNWKEVVAGNGVMGVLNWVRGKINGSTNGLVVEAVLVLGKLVGRGSEEGWF